MDNYEDMILPDGFEIPTNTTEIELSNSNTTNTEVTKNEDNSTNTDIESTKTNEDVKSDDKSTEQPQTQKIKIKYNKEEKEISLEEAQELSQKGMNYDKAVERAKQEARDSYIAEQGYTWNNIPITTEQQYKDALREQELIEKYQNQNLPEEVIKELLESKKFREESKELQKVKAEEESRKQDYVDFLEWFESNNGKSFDANKDQIPQEVWDLNSKGKSLVDAYASCENKQLRDKIKQLEHNSEVSKKAPIKSGVSNNTTNVTLDDEDDFLKGFNSI